MNMGEGYVFEIKNYLVLTPSKTILKKPPNHLVHPKVSGLVSEVYFWIKLLLHKKRRYKKILIIR
jgi:hypothetical protein